MYIYIYMNIYTYIYVCIRMYIYMNICIYTYIHIYIYMCIFMCVYAHIHTCIQNYRSTLHSHVSTYLSIPLPISLYIHAAGVATPHFYTYLSAYTWRQESRQIDRQINRYIDMHLYQCSRHHTMYVCLSVCLSVCIYVCMYVCMCMYTETHTCTRTHIFSYAYLVYTLVHMGLMFICLQIHSLIYIHMCIHTWGGYDQQALKIIGLFCKRAL